MKQAYLLAITNASSAGDEPSTPNNMKSLKKIVQEPK
jgi:hypothetical protein